MILTQGDKRNIVEIVKKPFMTLAGKNEGSLSKKACLRIFKEKYLPPLKDMETQYAEIYSRLQPAMYIEYEAADGATGYVKIPTGLGKIPWLANLAGNSDWQRTKGSVITRKDIEEALKVDESETFAKSQLLIVKATRVEELLKEWLQPFTMPEQLQFSLPQLGFFLNQIDFRKRRSWGVAKPPLQLQRRPRVINVPSDELKGLVAEASILAQSPIMKEIAE